MHRPHILITQPVHGDVLQRLQAVATVDMHRGPEPLGQAELALRLQGAHAMMGFMTERVDAALLRHAPQLRVVAAALKGYDNYDAAACRQAGVVLTIVPDLLTVPTAELAIGLAIALGRHVRDGDQAVRSGRFNGWRPILYGQGLAGATVAVVGLGAVGRAIAQRLRGFDCTLLGVDSQAEPPEGVQHLPLADALAAADWVLLALPLSPATHSLINDQAIAHARRGALWVNVGRGSVVDEEAMARHLATGQAGGYAADVFAFEDWAWPERPPAVPIALRAQPRTLFTPHLGSAVGQVRRAIEHRAADNIIAVLGGQPPLDAVLG